MRATKHRGNLPPEVQLSLGAELRRALSGWAYRVPMRLVGLAHRAHAPWTTHRERVPHEESIAWAERNVLDPATLEIIDQALHQAWRDLEGLGHPATKEELARCLTKLIVLERDPSLLAAKAVIRLIQSSNKTSKTNA
jgi:hypothetical protein